VFLLLHAPEMNYIFTSVFHRILDFKRGRISIQPFFMPTRQLSICCFEAAIIDLPELRVVQRAISSG
jgi:hypothetical protein